MFRKVKSVNDIKLGSRFIDCRTRKIVECVNGCQLGGSFEFAEVDNQQGDTWIYSLAECRQYLHSYNLTDNELRAVLCMSMFEFIEYVFYYMKNKNKGEEKL